MEALTEENARAYMNYLARAIRVVTDFPGKYEDLLKKKAIAAVTKKIDNTLDKSFHYEEDLFSVLSLLLTQAEDANRNGERYLEARAIALHLDRRISYDHTTLAGKYSIASLVPYIDKSVVTLKTLNDNEKITRICIMPYMEAVKCVAPDNKKKGEKRSKDLHMKWVLTGINNELQNCRYRFEDENVAVNHVVVSWEAKNNVHSGYFRVAFAPLTNEADFLNYVDETVTGSLGDECRRRFEEPNKPKVLEKRLKEVVKLAASSGKNFDLFFAPEMLGTAKMYETDFLGANVFVEEMIEACGEHKEGMPKVVVLPSRTTAGQNYCQIVNCDGSKLGDQFKMHPVNLVSAHCDEYLKDEGKINLLILHIPGYERIAILICKDFLAEDKKLHELLYQQINPTLVIVPSYTLGEMDFTEGLSSVKKFGTSVIWGTCCGAPITPEPYIGAASIIRFDPMPKMSDVCRCGRRCDESKACIFYIDLPLEITEREKADIQFHHLYI